MERKRKISCNFLGEWTRTGDKYTRRPDGRHVYCGRTDDMLKISGIGVSSFEVEATLLTHNRVLRAIVVSKEEDDGLTTLKAFVILKDVSAHGDDALYETLKDHMKSEIGQEKYPRWIEFVNDLPKTATGKIQRLKLHD